MRIANWLQRLTTRITSRRRGNRIQSRRPEAACQRFDVSPLAERLEERTLLTVSPVFDGINKLTITFDAASDHAYVSYDGANFDVGTTEGGNDLYNGTDAVTQIVVVDGGAFASQIATFSGSNAFPGALTNLTVTGIETSEVKQSILAGTAVSGDASTVNVVAPGRIQDGIDLATSGATVNVADGSYAGGILIDKTLNVIGTALPTVTAADLNGQPVGFQIGADNVVLDGFDVTGTGTEYGVLFSDKNSSPAYTNGTVRNSQFSNLGYGLATADGTFDFTNAIIQNNVIDTITNPAGGGWGIYLQSGSGHQVLGNTITGDNTGAGILVANTSNVAIGGSGAGQGNSISGVGYAVYAFSSANVSVVGNTISGMSGISGAVRLEGGNSGFSVTQNAITGGAVPAVLLRDSETGTPNSSVVINNNILTGNTHGIRVTANGLSGTLDAKFNNLSGSSTASVLNDSSQIVDASGNYFGSSVPATVSATILGAGAANVDFTPLLDNDESVANQSVVGFQADLSSVTVHTLGAQTGTTGRIQEGINTVTSGGTVNVAAGTYTEATIVVNKSVHLLGTQQGVAAHGRVGAESIIKPLDASLRTMQFITGVAGSVIDGFSFDARDLLNVAGTAANVVGSTSGLLDNLQFLNNRISGFTKKAVDLNDSGKNVTVDQNEFDGTNNNAAVSGIFHLDTDIFDGFYFTNNWVINAANTEGFYVDGNRNVLPSTLVGARNPLISGNHFNNNNVGANIGRRSLLNATITLNEFSDNNFDGLQGGPKNSTITRNTFTGNNRWGLALSSLGGANGNLAGTGSFNNEVTENFFSNNTGLASSGDIVVSSDQPAGNVGSNKIFNNSLLSPVGVTYNTTAGHPLETVQASGNWWGAATNPEFTGTKVAGTATANIDYSPWLNSGTDTDLGTAGFQGDFSTLNVDDDSAFSTLAYGSVTPSSSGGTPDYVTEGYDLLTATGTLNILSGTYFENVSTAGKAVTLSPGASPGQVTINGNLTLDGNDALSIEIDGTGSSQYDSLTVNGTVTLGTPGDYAALNILQSPSSDLTPDGSTLQTFTIIGNDDASDSVTGTFLGKTELSTVTLNGQPLYISYFGGTGDATGNDVVLTSQPVLNGTAGNDTFVIRRNAGNTATEVSLNGGAFVDLGTPGGIVINARGGDDKLTVDYANGDPLPTGGITYSGGGQTTSPLGDMLKVKGTGAESATYTPSSTVNGDGVISIGGKTITFTGLEPVDVSGLASFTFVTPNGNDSVTLVNGVDFFSGATNALRISGSSNSVGFETVAVWNTTSVTVDAATNDANPTSANDSVTVTSATLTGAGGSAITNLTIDTGLSGTDTVTVNGAISMTGNLTIDTGSVAQNANILVGTTSIVDVSATTGAITMASGTVTGNGFAVAGSSITYTANTNFTVGTLTMGAGTINATATTGSILTQGSTLAASRFGVDVGGTINLMAGTDIGTSTNQVFVRDFGGTINATANATTGNVYLFDDSPLSLGAISAGTTSGTVQIFGWAAIEDANGALTNVTAKNAILLAGQPGGSTTGGIGSGDALETAVANIAFSNPDTGSSSNVQISNTGALTVASLGALTTSSNAAGSITLSATDNLTVDVALDPTTVTLNSDDDVIINAAVTAADLIDVNAGLDGSGSATVGTAGTLTVTASGSDITIDSGTSSGSIALNGTSTSVTAVDNVILTASAGQITTGNATSDVAAERLTATASTGIELDTTITTLTSANVTGTGAIDISDTAGGLAVSSATTNNGSITLNATGGDLTLTIVTAGNNPSNISATTTTSGNILVGNVTATSDTITLNAAGAIEEIGGGDAGADISADILLLTAATGIGGTAQIEIDGNTGGGSGLTANVTGTGAINLRDTDGIRVNSATTNNGSITLEAANGNLTLTTVTAVGTGANIVANTLAGTGIISVGVLTADSDTVTLSAFTNIADGNATTTNNVTADSLNASSATGIDLDTTITTLTNASVSGTGTIDINDLAGGLSVTSATTNFGTITLNATGGNLTLATVTASTAGGVGNVIASTTTSGDILVDNVTAAGDNIQLNSAAKIDESGSEGTADLTSGTATLLAVTGIGGAGTIEVDFTTLSNVQSTISGVIDVSDLAGGLLVSLAATNSGHITLNATGGDLKLTSVSASGNGSVGNVVASTTTSGNLLITYITAAGDNIQLTSAGTIDKFGSNVNPDLTSGTATLSAVSGIGEGVGGTIEVSLTTLTSASVSGTGGIKLSDTTGGLVVTSATTNFGDITLSAASGNLTLTTVTASTAGGVGNVIASTTTSGDIVLGSVSAAGDGVRLAAADAITDNNTTANNVTALSLQLVAASGIGSTDAIETTVTNLAASNSASNNIQVVNTGALTITSVGPIGGSTVDGVTNSAASGTISIQANSPLTVSSAVSGPGDILLQAGNSALDDDDLTINANVTSTGGGTIDLIAGDDISQTGGTITSTAGAGARLVKLTADNEGVGGGDPSDRGGISQTAGNILATNLVARSYDSVGLGAVTTNNVTNLAASVTNSGASFSYKDADGVDITTVDSQLGITTNAGAITVNATSGTLTVSQPITSTTGTGGGISISGAVTLNNTVTAAGGTVTLNGNTAATSDLDINFALVSSASMSLTAPRDILVGALVQTGSGSNITLTADSEGNGVGGVRVETAGQVDSGNQVTISGSDLSVVGGAQSVQIDSDGATAQVKGVGAISISSGAAAPTTADIVVNGLISGSSSATVAITANQDVTFGVDGDITTSNGTITVTAGNTSDVITMANGTVFTAGTNSTTTLTADGSVTLGAIDSGSGLVKVTSTSGAILDADASTGVDITAGSVALRAETGVGSDTDAIETAIGGGASTLTLAARTNSGDIKVSNTGSFTIGTVDTLVGVTILDTINDNTGGDNITLVAASPLTVDSAIADNDGGNITLAANGNTTADDVTLNADVTAAGGNGNVFVYAGDWILLNQPTTDIQAAGTGAVLISAGTNYNNGGALANGTNSGTVSMFGSATITSQGGNITLRAPNYVDLGIVNADSDSSGAVGDIVVTADYDGVAGGLANNIGGITDQNGATVNLTGNKATLRAADGIGHTGGGDIDTNIATLDVQNSTSGDIKINETNAVTVVNATESTAGNISIVAGGTITVDDLTGSATTVVATVSSGTISLDANGASSDIVLNDSIQSASGNITLTADNDMTAGADGDITSSTGNLQVTADVTSGVAVSVISMNGGTLWNAGSGTIDLDTDGSITLGGLQTTNAGLTAVTIDTTAGAVADGGNTFVNIVANSGRVVINAVTGVGSGNALETTIASLDVDNATSGNIQINETDAITVFDAQEATAGDISIVAGGTITVDNGGAVTNAISTVGAGTITLDANGAASDIVLNDGVQSVTGTITLTADNDVTTDAEGDITSSSGNLSVTADAASGVAVSVITMADGALWNAGSGTITLLTDGDITLGGLKTTNNTTSAVSITTTAGGVVDGGDTDVDIIANNTNARTTISAVTGVGSANDIETTVSSIDVSNTTSGNIDLDETDAISVIRLSNTVTLDSNGTTGSIQLIADGTITIVASGSSGLGVSATDGNINIDADTTNSDVVVNHTVMTTSSGSVAISADDSVTFAAAGDVTASGNGGVTVTGNANASDGDGNDEVFMADGALIDAGSGTITVSTSGTNGGSVTLGGLLTTNTGTSAVTITSNAAVLDGGDLHVDIDANGVGSRVTITAVSNIGNTTGTAANRAIDTTIASLDASVTGAGLIDIDETDAIVLFAVDTANGAITVDAGGQITATNVLSSTDSDANDIILDSATDIVVTLINAGTANGDVLLDAAGSITESAVNTTVKITADGLRLVTGTGGVASETGTVGTAQATTLLDTTVNELEASIAASGLFLVNTQALTLIDQDLLGTGNDNLDRDGNGATAITSTSGTVRVNTTAGSLTFGELVNATGQLASFNAVGIFSDADGDSSSSDVNADRVAFRSTGGVGTTSNAVEINETNATNGLAFVNSTAGDVSIRDVAGGLVINDVDSLTSSSNTTGVITITALSPLTVDHNVTASGNILMTATDSAGTGDNLTVTTLTTIQSTGANVTLRAGDDMYLIDSSNIIATSGLVTLLGDFGNADPGADFGSQMNLFGTISSGTQAIVNGDIDNDTINLNPGSGHFASSILLDGMEGSDTYVVQFGRLTTGTMSVYVNDSGTGDDDFLTTNGTSAAEEVNVFNNVLNGSDLSGGYVQNTALGGTPTEQVNYNGNLERLLVHGQDGNEFFHVRASRTTRISLNGGNTNFGPGLTDNLFVSGVKGDVLDLQTLNNTFDFIGTTFFVDDIGVPNIYKGITIRNLENVPLIPLPTTTPIAPATTTWKLDFDSTSLQTQAGYTSVAPGRVYGTGTATADFGWASVAAGHNDRGDGLTSVFENALQDYHYGDEARVFEVDVPEGWYLVSIKSGDKNASLNDLEVRNANTQRLLLNGLNSAAGEFVTGDFAIQVLPGETKLRLQFSSGSGTSTRWNINSLEIQPGKILTIGSPDPGVLAADGLTIETYTGYESVVGSLANGTLVTITPGIDTSGDEIPDALLEVTSPDADPNLEGVQSIVSGGQWTYSFRRPNVSGSAFVAFEAVLPNAVTQTGSLAVDFVAPSIRRYDFNAPGSPTQPPVATALDPTAYVGVLSSDLKLPTNGYGWVSSPASFDRGAGFGDPQSDLRRDGAAGTSTGVFQTSLTPGTYFVNVTMGDLNASHDNMIVRANGITKLPDVDTTAGQSFHNTFSVSVGNSGLLSLEFLDAGGDPTWVANGVEIRGASQVKTATFSSALGGVTADGSTADTITVNLTNPVTGLPFTLTANTLFTLSSSLGTIVSADTSTEYMGTQVLAMAGSSSFTFQVQRPSSVGTPTFTATAIDGSSYGTGADTNGTALNYTAPAFRRFDFNSASSPTQSPTNPPSASGYQAVTTTALYSAGQGYGWDTTAPSSFDRGVISGSTYSDLLRDGHLSSTARQFRIDSLGSATYSVTVTMGDLNAMHDQMSVSILTGIGTGVTGVTNTSGQFVQRTFTATPVGGTLVFEFSDAGGSDPSWVVNAIELNTSPVAAIAVPTTSPGTADGTTVDSFSISGLVSGQVYTVSATAGTLVQNAGGSAFVDADSAFSGNQIVAASGSATLFVKRPSGPGTSTITVTQVTGGSIGSGIETYAGLATQRFDFNGSTNVTAAGFTGVRGSKLYSAADGYGFATAVSDVTRGTTGYAGVSTVALYQDFVTGSVSGGAKTFQYAVTSSAQTYNVRVYTGDRNAARDKLYVLIEGGLGDPAVYSALFGYRAANTYTNVTFFGVKDLNGNGVLDIAFQDIGNTTPAGKAAPVDGWVVNGLDISTGALPAAAPQALPGLTFNADGMDARSQAILNSLVRSGETLTDERLSTVVADAIARWSSLGLSDEQLARLNGVEVRIADLDSRGDFGLAGSENILIDNDALGLGWHIGDGPVPAGQVDLLSVMLHELGHIVGYGDLDPQLFPNSLMAGEIQAGQERGLEGFDLASGTNGPAHHNAVAAGVVDASLKTSNKPSSADLFGNLAGSPAAVLSLGSASGATVLDKPETVDTPVIVNERKRIADHDAVFLGFDLIFDELETI